MKKELNILLLCTALWCGGIVVAPAAEGTWFSDVLYRLFSAVCHQFGSRSFHLGDEPFGVCIRCTSIYSSFLTVLIALRFSSRLRVQKWNTSVLLFITASPVAIDGILSLFHIIEATTISRIITGSLFGAGCALLLHTVLCESIQSLITLSQRNYEFKT
ncbi:MAG: DUF2085 domain-containing protein [Bacteroidota bacterium]|jgi:uncharacterized membrane protein